MHDPLIFLISYKSVKLIQITKYGSSDVMEVNNTGSIPNPPQEKILVNIKASGVNPVDWKIREGHLQQVFPLRFQSTLGMDFLGVIKHLGENVPSDLKQGDEYMDKPLSLVVVQEHLLN